MQRLHSVVGGLLLWAALAPWAWAQADRSAEASPSAERPRVALVLSGGGARGFAHVGLLKALEDASVPVDWVVGTSMGAIVGGLYATGMDAAELEREILTVDWEGLFSARPPRQALSQRQKEQDLDFATVVQLGFFDGEFRLPQGTLPSRSLEWLLRRYTLAARHLPDFDALPLPFRAVATDMESGQGVVLARGDLAAALRASMSVPGLFAPLAWEGRLLGDGGLVDNLPVTVARQLGADAVIAINIGTPLAPRQALDSVVGVTLQMINILTEQNVARSVAQLGRQDLLLSPPLGELTAADFGQARQLIELGHRYADTLQQSLQRFAVPPADYAAWQAQRQQRRAALQVQAQPVVAAVRLEGVPSDRLPALARSIESQPGQAIAPDRIARDLQRLAATDDVLRVDYRLEPLAPGSRDEALVFQIEDDPWAQNRFRLGLDLRTDFQGQGDFGLRISHTRHWASAQGAQWRNHLSLGATVAAGTEYYQPLGADRGRFVSVYADHELRRIELFDSAGDPYALFRRRTSRLGVDGGWPLGRNGEWGALRLGWVGARRQSLPQYLSGQPTPASLTWTDSAVRLALVTDQLDHAHFPQTGHRFKLDVQVGHSRREPEARSDFVRWDSAFTWVHTQGAHTWNSHLEVASARPVPTGAVDEYSLGGFQRLSGYRIGQVAGNHLALARLNYYRRLPWAPGPARAWFAGGSLELGNAWTDSNDIRWRGLRTGSSLYLGADTGIGPVYLSLVHAPRGYTGLYFLLGRP